MSPSSYSTEFSKHPILNTQTPSDNLYIKPLLKETSEEDLRNLFAKYGNIVDCKVMVDRNTGLSRQIGFVRYENKEHAKTAIEEMNNYKLDPSAPPLTVKYADTKEQKTARKALRQKQQNLAKGDRYGSSPSSPPLQTTYYYYQQSPYGYSYPAYQYSYPLSPSDVYNTSPYQSPPQFLAYDSYGQPTWVNYGENGYYDPNDIFPPSSPDNGFYPPEGFPFGYSDFEGGVEEYYEISEGTPQQEETEEETQHSDGERDTHGLPTSSPIIPTTPPIDIVH